MKIPDSKIHDDWYFDGDFDEALWRLDFACGNNEFQAQLFAEISPQQLDDDPGRDREDEDYVSFRLFLERDNRAQVGLDMSARVDYACDGWYLTPQRALELLEKGVDSAERTMRGEIARVAALPCDRTMCDLDGNSRFGSRWNVNNSDRREEP